MDDNKIISGDDIESLQTINSMYANGRIQVNMKDGSFYMIKVTELIKLMSGQNFGIEMARKYGYLFKLD